MVNSTDIFTKANEGDMVAQCELGEINGVRVN